MNRRLATPGDPVFDFLQTPADRSADLDRDRNATGGQPAPESPLGDFDHLRESLSGDQLNAITLLRPFREGLVGGGFQEKLPLSGCRVMGGNWSISRSADRRTESGGPTRGSRGRGGLGGGRSRWRLFGPGFEGGPEVAFAEEAFEAVLELDLDAFAGLAAPDALACGEAVDRDHENGVLSCEKHGRVQPRSRAGKRVAGSLGIGLERGVAKVATATVIALAEQQREDGSLDIGGPFPKFGTSAETPRTDETSSTLKVI